VGAVAGGPQFGHECLDRALGESDRGADVTDPGFGVASDLNEHVPVHQASASGVQLRVAAGPAMQRIRTLICPDHGLDTFPAMAAAPSRAAEAEPGGRPVFSRYRSGLESSSHAVMRNETRTSV
jgi:hypothetical protein